MTMASNKKRTDAFLVQFDNSDPLWNETPKMGVEGLIATIENEEELLKKLIEVGEYQKKLKKGAI